MDRVLILSIETATGCGSVALTRGDIHHGRLLAECTSQPDITHSRRLLGSVDWLMETSGTQWQDLDAIAVSLGPGSFTGLRIGMAAAKGIAMATNAPFVGVSTLDALVLPYSSETGQICCVIDARKQEVYAAMYRVDHAGVLQQTAKVTAISPQDLLALIREPTLMVGPGVAEYGGLFAEHHLVRVVSQGLTAPRAAYIGFFAARLLAEGKTMDPSTAAPDYVRASEAELHLREKKVLAVGQSGVEAAGQEQ